MQVGVKITKHNKDSCSSSVISFQCTHVFSEHYIFFMSLSYDHAKSVLLKSVHQHVNREAWHISDGPNCCVVPLCVEARLA